MLKQDCYTQCQSDHTLFVKHLREGKIVVLVVYVHDIVLTGNHAVVVYVDDIVLTGNHAEEIAHVKLFIAKEFEMKDLGHLKCFREMEVVSSYFTAKIFY